MNEEMGTTDGGDMESEGTGSESLIIKFTVSPFTDIGETDRDFSKTTI
jgi:hypothetical protein